MENELPTFEEQEQPQLPKAKPVLARYNINPFDPVYVQKNSHPVHFVVKAGYVYLRYFADVGAGDVEESWNDIRLGREHAALLLMMANRLHAENKCAHSSGNKTVNTTERRYYCADCTQPMPLTCDALIHDYNEPRRWCENERFLIIDRVEEGKVWTSQERHCPACEERIAKEKVREEQVRAERAAKKARKADRMAKAAENA